MTKGTLWTRNYNLLTIATILGAAGGIAGSYAMGFLVFDETGSTFAAGLLVVIRVIPQFFLPILIAPWMDRLPRKPFLVGGDLLFGILYGFAGLYLHCFSFHYTGYLLFSLLLACIGTMDSLAYNSIFPKVIPKGFEDKGYTVSGMLYPVMSVLIMPIAALLLEWIGVANILLLQGACSIIAALLENGIKIEEKCRINAGKLGFFMWFRDLCDGFRYIKGEKGLRSIFSYMAVTNGAAMGYEPILTAFFRSTPGFSAWMYSFFAVAEFAGRALGGIYHYHLKIPKKNRFCFTFAVYQVYELMDFILLWLPYPLMLANRGICGFLGINSATTRVSAVQTYLPDEYRSRATAIQNALTSAAGSGLALVISALGEFFPYKIAMSIVAIATCLICWITIWGNRNTVNAVYLSE